MAEKAVNKPGGLRAQAKADVTRRIREAAETLFMTRDFGDVTTREIAQQAGIGEATLFRYVASKDELLTMIYGDQMQTLVDRLEAADDALAKLPLTVDRVLQRIYAFYEGRSEFFLLHPDNAARYLRQSYDLSSSGRERAMALGDRVVTRVTTILEKGQREGLVSDVVEASLVALNCHGAFLHEVNRTRTRGFEPESIWERVLVRLDAQLLPLMRSEEAGER